MAASIRSTLHVTPGGAVTGPILVDTSRDDLRKGYQVVLESVDAHTTYAWTLAFTPDSPDGTDSAAAFLAPEGSVSQTAKFNVDYEGSYLVRLIVDASLTTEDVIFLRFRFLTRFGDIKLVAAGERRDENGVIPEDADLEGWANDQNQNVQKLLAQVRRTAISGRVLYVEQSSGRDRTDTSNDPTNFYTLPGADPADTADELAFKAERHGDFTTINEAITFANAAVSRGEPAPSAAQPYYVFVRPGLYTEDLSLQPWIHIIGMSEPYPVGTDDEASPIIRTVNAGGATHDFSPSSDTDVLVLQNLTLENTADVTTPVLNHTRGILMLLDGTVHQKGTAVAQGEAILSNGGVNVVDLRVKRSKITSDATNDDDRWAIRFDGATGSSLDLDKVEVTGRSAVSFNEDLVDGNTLKLDMSTILGGAGYGLRAYGETINLWRSWFNSTDITESVVFDPFGAGPLTGNVSASLYFCWLPQIQFDATGVTGNTLLNLSSNVIWSDDAVPVVFTGGTLPTTYEAGTHSQTLRYATDYQDPTNLPTPVVPIANQITGYDTMQEAIDLLVHLINPSLVGWPTGFILEDAYNGIASISPFTVGAGLGRTLLADDGAVQITGAPSPASGIVDTALDGGLQTEGPIDIGPLQTDGLGSEIYLNPETFGVGPRIQVGRNVWPTDLPTGNRALPASVLMAGTNLTGSAPGSNGPYNLWLSTRSQTASGTDNLGKVILAGGRTNEGGTGDTNGGPVFLQGGDVLENSGAGLGGTLHLVPGWTNNAGNDGRINIVMPSTMTAATLQAFGAMGAGVAAAGSIYFATPDRIVQVDFVGGENFAASLVLINTAADGEFIASDAGGGTFLLTTSHRGPLAEILYLGDSVADALNASLGGFSVVTDGATFTAGTVADNVEMECTADGVLTVHGSIISTPGDYVHITVADTPYALGAAITKVGVDSSGGTIEIDLPAAPDDGQILVVKDESGNAWTNNITIDGGVNTIEGAATQVIDQNHGSMYLLYGITEWHILNWYKDLEYASVAVTPYTIPDTGVTQVGVDTTVARTVNLPASPEQGTVIFIKDVTGSAETNNITVDGVANTIDGAGTHILAQSYGSVTVFYNGSEWQVLSTYGVGDYISIDGGGVAYDILQGYTKVGVNTVAGAKAVNLPTGTYPIAPGTIYHIKDYTGSAVTNNITVDPTINTIDGAATYTIDQAYGSVSVVWSDLGDWHVVAFYPSETSVEYVRYTAVGTYTLASTTTLVGVSTALGAITLQLPASSYVGQTITIKDEGGQAGVNNITIDANTHGLDLIDGANTATISLNYGSLKVYSDGSDWWIM